MRLGVPKSTQKYQKKTKKYQKVLKSTKKYPQIHKFINPQIHKSTNHQTQGEASATCSN